MKCLVVVPVFLLLAVLAFGQMKIVSQSPVFGDSETEGIQKVLLMKNGNTCYLSLGKKSLTVRLYSPKGAVKATKQLHPHLGKASSFIIKGLYDMSGDIVLLVSAVDNHQVVLQRVIIDGKTAVLKDEEKIGELERVSYFKLAGTAFGNVPVPDFFSEPMPDGNGYTVVAMNSFQPDRNKRVVVWIYGTDNKELSHAFYKSPDDKYKYIEFIDLAPLEKNKLGVLAYGYNTKASGGKECELLFGTLTTGDTLLTINKLGTSREPAKTTFASYNPVSKKIMLLEIDRNDRYSAAIVDPVNKTAATDLPVGHNIPGAPLNVFSNNDGTFAVVYEKMYSRESQYSKTISMEDFTVSILSPAGRETSQFTAPRNHVYRAGRSSDIVSPDDCIYLNADGKYYLFVNEDADNMERVKDAKNPHKTKSIEDCDAFYYALNSNSNIPVIEYLFGKPAEKNEHNLGDFRIYDYNPDNKIYVAVKAELRGKDTNWRLIWIKI